MSRPVRRCGNLALMALVFCIFSVHYAENAQARPIEAALLGGSAGIGLSLGAPSIALTPFLSDSTQEPASAVAAEEDGQHDAQTPSTSAPVPSSPTLIVSSKLPVTASWEPPVDFVDMSCFGVNKFAYGQENIALVVGELPVLGPLVSDPGAAGASAAGSPISDPTMPGEQDDDDPAAEPQDDDDGPEEQPTPSWSSPNGTMFQVRYPAGSINPGSNPRGGADFYALPASLATVLPAAHNVTLEYSVYFPADFDWVKGGKLPGLYGGHDTCSGGDSAESCFSTRMMWREDGVGELYLYAPRDKQGESVCNTPPKSVCETEYGMSVGRGSFKFAQGGWTRISQTVVLNTPGAPDGSLVLDINGQRAMSLDGVYYRNDPTLAGDQQIPGKRSPQESTAGPSASAGKMEGGAAVNQQAGAATPKWQPPIIVFDAPASDPVTSQVVGFSGLFFSTFFGGHDEDYATPKDQYSYFGDFAMTVNS